MSFNNTLSMSMFASKKDFEAAMASQPQKQVVHYESATFFEYGTTRHASVIPIDHPSPFVINGMMATTSEVVWNDDDTGIFETKNTIYVPKGTQAVD